MQRIARLLVDVPIWIACVALFVLMIMTFFDVIMRSAFDAPIEAASELTRILIAVAVFAVMPHISVSDRHIAVDLADRYFARAGLSRVRDGVLLIVCGSLLCWPVARVWKLAARTRDYGDVTQYLGIPQHLAMHVVAIGVTISAAAMIVAGLLKLVPRRAGGPTDP